MLHPKPLSLNHFASPAMPLDDEVNKNKQSVWCGGPRHLLHIIVHTRGGGRIDANRGAR